MFTARSLLTYPESMSDIDLQTIEAAEQLIRQAQWRVARERALPLLVGPTTALRARAVLANASMQLGDFDDAVVHFRVLSAAQPSHAGIARGLSMALNNSGSRHLLEHDREQAESRYREALQVDSTNATAAFNLAALLQARRDFAAAASTYLLCERFSPGHLEARLQAAVCERARGAVDTARTLLTALRPEQCGRDLAHRIGMEWMQHGDTDLARRFLAVGATDATPTQRLQWARAALDAGDVESARDNAAAASRAAALSGNDGEQLAADLLGALALPKVPDHAEAIQQARAAFGQGIAWLQARWPAARLQASNASLDDLAHRHLELAYYGEDDRPLASAFGDWFTAAATALAGVAPSTSPVRGRIALISGHWTLGTISAYFGAWIGALRNAGWEVDLIQVDPSSDTQTDALARDASTFLHLTGSLKEVVETLHRRAPGVILYPEVGLSPRVHVLAALRLAPVQIAAWGHPVTSGLASIDYWLSSAEMEPVDADTHYRERLVTLPALGTRYVPASTAARSPRTELGLADHHHLYVVPHAAVKLHPTLDAMLVAIALRDPSAQFLLFEDGTPALTLQIARRLQAAFGAKHLQANAYIRWLPRTSPEGFRQLLASSDVMLDAMRFSGGNTSLDAIAQGLPLVTLPGPWMRSRQTAAMLRRCGVPELIASSADDYVETAVRVATDLPFAAALRQRLRDGAGHLFNDETPLAALVDWLQAWR